MAEPEDKQEQKPTEGKPAETKPAEQAPAEPAPDPFEGINARLASMEQAQSDMMKAISALANQGAVNASVAEDNKETGADEYPTIDLDSINRLIGD